LLCQLPHGTAGTLSIFEPCGRLVRSLSGGESAFVWDGRDEAGRRVAEGVYLYRLVAGTDVIAGRVVRVE
jgi:flagellar hook assembly protein FlgD